MIRPRFVHRWLTALPSVATLRHRPRRALLTGATVAAVAVAVGIGAHSWANAAPAKSGPAAPPRAANFPPASTTIPGSYIVTLKNRHAGAATVQTTAATLTRAVGGIVTRTYSHALTGFAAHMSAAQAKAMAARSEVAKVSPDRVMRINDTVANPPWNLDRVDQPYLPLDNSYTFPVSASSVHAYVIDTGIHIGHTAFGGRASYGPNFADGNPNSDDCNGHGTHVAGTIGATGFGVAPGTLLVAVKVVDCNGSGTESGVIAGVDWVTANAAKPAVANMSLGGMHDDVIDAAVANSINSGVTYSIAAGNDSLDSCVYDSPADVPAAITVGATDKTDHRAFFSSYGSCLDVFAPGVDVVSLLNADTGTAVKSGTSMAAPQVAGAAALILQANPSFTPQQVRDTIVNRSVTDAVDNPGIGSPDRLLQVEAATPAVAPEVIRLRARANGLIVTADPSGNSRLIANRIANGAWEEFDVVDAGGGFVGLRAHSNGKFVSADGAGTQPLINNRSSIGAWEMFKITTHDDGSINLLANANNKFVTADDFGKSPLIANRAVAGPWETFDPAVPNSVLSLGSFANGKIVTADAGGAAPLIANRNSIGAWEEFDSVDMGNGFVGLRAHANGKYVTAEAAGTMPLIANRAGVSAWEEFQIIINLDGTVSFTANANGKFVTAEAGGAAPLIARGTSIGDWQEYAIIAD